MLLHRTIAKYQAGHPLTSFSLKALVLLEGHAVLTNDVDLEEEVRAEVLSRLPDGNPSSPA